MFSRILVPLDGSELAESILPHVEYLASLTGAEITVLRVVVPIQVVTEPGIAYPVNDDAMIAASDEYIKGVARSLVDRGFKARGEIRFGQAGEEIIEYAEENGADLVAMCTHGRSGLSRWAFGSVADKVLRATGKPVLLLKPDGTASKQEL